MIKLYYTPSSCSLVVRITLNALNIDFQEEAVDLRNKKTADGSDYWAINSKGSVPAIALNNGEVLTENQVILQYLADTTPGQKLLAPVGDMKRYRTLEWLNYMATELHKSIGMFFNPIIADEVKAKMTPLIMKKFAYIDQHLTKNQFLMGEQFTLPDAYLFVMLRWAHYFKMDCSSFKNITHYFERLQGYPAIVKSLAQEQ